MVKQTKKGSIGKKALSAILAASMIMTSSSFVMAGPVVEEVKEVKAAAVEEVDATEDNAGVELQNVSVTVEDATYTGEEVKPKVTVVGDGETLVENIDYNLTYSNNTNVSDTATVKVTFTQGGNYEGNNPITKEFSIKPLVLNSTNTKVTFPIAGYVYTGKKQDIDKATITVYGDINQKVITDADLAYDAYSDSYDLKSVGSQKAKLVDKNGNIVFDDSVGVYDFMIEKAAFDDKSVVVDSSSQTFVYTGKPVEANVVLKVKGTDEVIDPSTYTLKYFDKEGKVANGPQTDIHDGYRLQIVCNGNGNFKAGTIDTTYNIVAGDFSTAVASATIAGTTKTKASSGTGYEYHLTYTGKEQSIAPESISIPGLTQGIDYEVDCSKAYGTNAGTFSISLTGKNNYDGKTGTLTVVIDRVLITKNDFTITAKCNKLTDPSTAAKKDLVVTVEKGDLKLEEGADKDFEITSVDPGKREVTIEGRGNFTTVDTKNNTTDITVKYTQASKLLIEKVAVDPISAKAWTGKQITPAVVVKDGSTTLEKGVDYQVSYGANVDAGIEAGTVTITGIGKYEGSRTVKFDITGTVIDSLFVAKANNITVDAAKAGNGKSTPIVSFTNGASAPADFTFDVKYYAHDVNNTGDHYKGAELTDAAFKALTNGKKVVVEVIGTGKYSGKIYTEYSVVEATNISDVADVADIADQNYTGKAIEPAVIVTPKTGSGVTLTKDKDYTVAYSYNTEVGTAYAIVAGIGNYAGEIVKSFKIVGEMTQNIEVLPAQEKALQTRTLNDKATKVKYTSAPKTTVTYASSNEDVVTIDAEGNIKYTGLGEATITIKAAAENNYNEAVKELKVVVGLKQPTFTPSSRNNAFTVTTSTVKGAEKFQVQYVPTGKSFNNAAAKTKTFTVDNKLKKGKVSAANKETYRVRVRAINGDAKSKWSPVKTIATL